MEAFQAHFAIAVGDERMGFLATGAFARGGQFRGHTAFIHSLAFSPDGRTLLSGSMDTTALLWDVRSRTGRSAANQVKLRANSGPRWVTPFCPVVRDGLLRSAASDALVFVVR